MDKGKERKKRKVEKNDEEETEEEKMEKFFALIESTRRVGVDRWKEGEDQVKENEEKRKINMAAAGWCPMFQPEDFEINKTSSVPAPTATQTAGPSTTAEDDQHKQEIVEEENDILNLKLSL